MKLKYVILFIVGVLALSINAQSGKRKNMNAKRQQEVVNGCDYEYVRFGDWCYYFSEPHKRPRLNFYDAEETCTKHGGQLASIHNSQENAFLMSQGKNSRIGLVYDTTEDNFTWSDNSCFDYKAKISPNFTEYMEYFGRCVKLSPSGLWENADCEIDQMPYICKKKPSMLTNTRCPDPNKLYLGEGNVSSPGYPLNFHGSNRVCIYQIAVPIGNLIKIVFNDLHLGSLGKVGQISEPLNGAAAMASRPLELIRIYEGPGLKERIGTINTASVNGTEFTTNRLNRITMTFKAPKNYAGSWLAHFEPIPRNSPSSSTPSSMDN